MQLTIREPGSAITHFIACQCFYKHSGDGDAPHKGKECISHAAAEYDQVYFYVA